jgi:hypothetical protein
MIQNLWEALLLRESSLVRSEEFDKYIGELGKSACLSMQEISLHPSKEGWIISIFGCNEDGKVEILIPKDRTQSIQILKDTRKESEYYNNY